MIKKGFKYLKHFGLKEFLVRLGERMEPEEVPYGPWYEKYKPTEAELVRQKKWKPQSPVKISVVVPAYRTPELFLRQMIQSVQAQSYENWELCIANASPDDRQMSDVLMEYTKKDERIQVKNLTANNSISENSNEAMHMVTGEFIGLLDHDDILAPDALYQVVRALETEPQADVF